MREKILAKQIERHFANRIGWLRAAVMGANDGIVSIASLVVGVAASNVTQGEIVTAGIAGLVAGAMSMAAGEYVSVSSQADTERADLEREQYELETDNEFELQELTEIYIARGLDSILAKQVAKQLMEHDALGAHARDELGLTEIHSARPIQAAMASAATFAIGAALPLLIAFVSSLAQIILLVSAGSLAGLALLGALSAKAGGAKVSIAVGRVLFWGALAMAATALIGKLFGTVV